MKNLLISIIIVMACSCKYSQKAAMAQVDKANGKYPAPVAVWLREKYPCIIKQQDTVSIKKDSIIYIDCPDLPTIIHEPGTTDTFIVHNIVKVPVTLPVITKYITRYIEDSAKITIMQSIINEKEKEIATDKATIKSLQNDINIMTDKRSFWRKWFFILATIFGAGVLLRIKKII